MSNENRLIAARIVDANMSHLLAFLGLCHHPKEQPLGPPIWQFHHDGQLLQELELAPDADSYPHGYRLQLWATLWSYLYTATLLKCDTYPRHGWERLRQEGSKLRGQWRPAPPLAAPPRLLGHPTHYSHLTATVLLTI
ncbi:unnamed protein product [Nezara viridula]|uniref:Uncharacterized protein n=1 Tax=Nezara viridula TaxID=85310 RepID=A0A9P0MNM0_NEZVI|nr:unnamed protein product [Nezara viridula]